MPYYRYRVLLIATLFLSVLVSVRTASALENAELYFFTSAGCPPCRQLEPVLESLTHEGHSITKIDVQRYPLWVSRFQIRSTPTLVLVKNGRELRRHSGYLDRATIQQWMQQADQTSSPAVLTRSTGDTRSGSASASLATQPNSSTMHRGTRTPANAIEQAAMDATVRLRVEDAEGFSYATGTVIHCHQGEWLVLTCGHVFRDAGGRGVITAEFDFGNGQPRRAPAKLISYDAEARDIGLVAINAGVDCRPIELAQWTLPVAVSDSVFSIGCDHGDSPTIRHSKIKNQAKYDGAKKYEIFGRPVVGRSGGGLFNSGGQLIGVCNAAAVDYDEGIYSSLENIQGQIAKVNLLHLFEQRDRQWAGQQTPATNTMAANSINPALSAPRFAENVRIPATAPIGQSSQVAGQWANLDRGSENPGMRKVNWQTNVERASLPFVVEDMEVVVTVRSRSQPNQTKSFTLPNPSHELLGYLEKVSNDGSQSRRAELAELRQAMPVVPRPTNHHYEMRAQSPDQ